MQKKVLLVDDARPLLQLMTVVLNKLNFEVLTAENGEQALKLIKEENPDLVLLDVVMPDLDGFEVCRHIKEDKNSTIKVILYTGNVDAVDNARARLAKADGFAVKTGDYTDILGQIREVLES